MLLNSTEMTKILTNLLLFFSIVTCFTACEKYSYVIEPPVIIPDVSFSEDIQPIFNANCVSCHNGGSISPDLRSENSFKALSEGSYLNQPPAEESILYKTIVDNTHSSFTNQDEKSKIYSWILQGAKEEIEEETE